MFTLHRRRNPLANPARGLLLLKMLVALNFLTTAQVTAQIGIGVSPPHKEFTLPPGGLARGRAVFFTQHHYRGTFTLNISDWTIDPRTGVVIALSPQKSPYSASSWIKAKIPADPLRFADDRPEVPIQYEVNVPNIPTLEGSYWAAIVLHTLPIPSQFERGIKVKLSMNVFHIIYVTIEGTERPGARIVHFGFGPAKKNLFLDVENTGNVFLRLRTTLTYKDAKGTILKAEKLPERVLLRDLLVRYQIPMTDVPEDAVVASVEVTADGLTSPLYAEVALK